MMSDDMKLLREYAERNSEEAFAALVSRYVNLVYSAALRQVHNPDLAREISQAVFIILAKKAKSLSPKTILPAWLCRAARYASANALTTQRRRQQREQEAYMQSLANESESDAWAWIAPLLDDAMKQLGQKDHDAILLRFFAGKSFKETAVALGASEDAVKMRVQRALEKLRRIFSKRGVALSATLIGAAISAHSVQAAPAGLAGAISTTVVAGSTVAASTLTLVKGTLKLMAWIKTKTMLAVGAGTLLAGAAVLTIHEQEEANRQQEQQIRQNEADLRAQEQQILAQEGQPNLSPQEKQQLDNRLNQLRATQNELRARQNKLRAAQNLLRQQDTARFAPSQQLSAFTQVRFDSGKVFVTYLGAEFELLAINDLTSADILDFCKRQYGNSAEKRFAEDLVIVLADLQRPMKLDNTVKLLLADPKTGQQNIVEHAAMTKENRQAVFAALHTDKN